MSHPFSDPRAMPGSETYLTCPKVGGSGQTPTSRLVPTRGRVNRGQIKSGCCPAATRMRAGAAPPDSTTERFGGTRRRAVPTATLCEAPETREDGLLTYLIDSTEAVSSGVTWAIGKVEKPHSLSPHTPWSGLSPAYGDRRHGSRRACDAPHCCE